MKIKNISAIALFIAICGVFYLLDQGGLTSGEGSKGVDLYWYAVVPPLLAIFMTFITSKLRTSLILAIIFGGVLNWILYSSDDFVALGPIKIPGLNYFISASTDTWNLQILGFVIAILVLIAVVIQSGGLQALIVRISKYSSGRKTTLWSTYILGLLIFIDDYANTMLVGNAMRPLADQYKISREKLAFIVDATAAPIAGIAFISTWVGHEVGLFGTLADSLSLPMDGYAIFFAAVPARFYCIFMIGFLFLNIFFEKDFGPMLKAERRAMDEGLLTRKNSRPMSTSSFEELKSSAAPGRETIWTASLPFAVLLISILAGFWLDGGGAEHFDKDFFSWAYPTTWRNVLAASENGASVLLYSTLVAIVVAVLGTIVWAKVPLSKILSAMTSGMKASILPVTILLLAWSLKNMCDAIYTGPFLVEATQGMVSPLWFPLAVFVIAGMTAFSIGTSWGTMGILIPTVGPIAFELDGSQFGLVMLLSLAAILDGAIFGDHCSPISDTTIMSSSATSCDHTDHVKTQLPYASFVAFIAVFAGYFLVAVGLPMYVAHLTGFALMAAFFFLLPRRRYSTQAPKKS